MRPSLDGQVCLVTGGAQGVGWAICQALADEGALVYACDISTENLHRAEQARARLPRGASIQLAHCDVTSRQDIEAWIQRTHTSTSRIDVLVNNAAFVRWETVMTMSVEEAERTMRVGYDAMVYGIKAVLPLMLSAGRGHIVNIGSSASQLYTGPVSAAYAAAKSAMDAYSHILFYELRDAPVSVTLVRPSTIAGTEFFKKHVPSARMPRVADLLPPLTPPQVAYAVVQAILKRRNVVDIPGYLPLLYGLFRLSPRVLHWLSRGSARRDLGGIEW